MAGLKRFPRRIGGRCGACAGFDICGGNTRIRALLVALAERHGEDVAHFVSETINGWEAKTIVEKLETNVGRDLQYIRINGTVIGGLIGLVLHAGSELIH